VTAWPRRPTYSGRGASAPSQLQKHLIGTAVSNLNPAHGRRDEVCPGTGNGAAAVLASASTSSEQKATAVLQALALGGSVSLRPQSASGAGRTNSARAAQLRRAGASAQGPSPPPALRGLHDGAENGASASADSAQAQFLTEFNKIGGQPGVTVSGNAISSTTAPSGGSSRLPDANRRGNSSAGAGMHAPTASGIAPPRTTNGSNVVHSSRGRRDQGGAAGEQRPVTPGGALGSARTPLRPAPKAGRGCWSGAGNNGRSPSPGTAAMTSSARGTPVVSQWVKSGMDETRPRHNGLHDDTRIQTARPATSAGFNCNSAEYQATTAGLHATKVESLSVARPHSAQAGERTRSPTSEKLPEYDDPSPRSRPELDNRRQESYDAPFSAGGAPDGSGGTSFPPLSAARQCSEVSGNARQSPEGSGTAPPPAGAGAAVARSGRRSSQGAAEGSRPMSQPSDQQQRQSTQPAAADEEARVIEDGAANRTAAASSPLPPMTSSAAAGILAAASEANATAAQARDGVPMQLGSSQKPAGTSLPSPLPAAESPPVSGERGESSATRGSLSRPPLAQAKKPAPARPAKPPTPPLLPSKAVDNKAAETAPLTSGVHRPDKDATVQEKSQTATAEEIPLVGSGVDGEPQCLLLGTEDLPLMGAAGVLVLPRRFTAHYTGRGAGENDLLSFGKEEMTGWGFDCEREELSADRLLEAARRDKQFVEYTSGNCSSEVTELANLDPESMHELQELSFEQAGSNWTPSQGPTLMQLALQPKRREECPVCNQEWTKAVSQLSTNVEGADAEQSSQGGQAEASNMRRRSVATGRAKMHSVQCCWLWYQQNLCKTLCNLRFDANGLMRNCPVAPNRVLPPPMMEVCIHWKQLGKGGRNDRPNQMLACDRLTKGNPPSNQA